MAWWAKRYSWRVEVTVAPQSETERRHAVIIVYAGNRTQASVKGLREALSLHPHKVWRDLTLSILPEPSA